MRFSKKFLFSSLIFFASVVSLLCFRQIPDTQLWKNYRTVYAESSALNLDNIYSVLLKNGCTDVIYEKNQRSPIVSTVAPVQPQDKNSYLVRRNAFFTDAEKRYSIFYVPDSQQRQLRSALDELNSFAGTFASVDGGTSFPWIAPLLTFCFMAAMFFFCGKKTLFIFNCAPLAFLLFCRPYWTVCAACILASLCFFLLNGFFGRRGFWTEKKLLLFVLPLIFFPAVFLFFSKAANSLCYISALFGSFSSLFLYDELRNGGVSLFNPAKTGFNFVYIKGCSSVRLLDRKGAKLFLSGFVLILIFIPFFYFSSSVVSASDSGKNAPLLPGPQSKNHSLSGTSVLPNLDDFVRWAWLTVSFPYRKLGEKTDAENVGFGDEVFVPQYKISGDKIIFENERVLVFNSSFVDSVYDRIREIEYPSLENLLYQQGKKSNFAYPKTGGTSSEKNAVSILLFFALIPFGLLVCYSLRLRRKRF